MTLSSRSLKINAAPGYCSAHLVGEARRRGAGSGQHKLAVLRGVGELLADPLAARLLEFNGAPGDDLRDLAALLVGRLAGAASQAQSGLRGAGLK